MASLIKRAADKQRSAMYQLLERHKNAVYCLACQLTGDESVAADITVRVFQTAWSTLTPTMTETAFFDQLTMTTYRLCKTCLTGKNPKALRMPQDRRYTLPPHTPVTDGTTALDTVKQNLSVLQWTMLILHHVSGLTREQQASLLKLDLPTLDIAWDAERHNLTYILEHSSHTASCDEVIAALVAEADSTKAPQSVKHRAEEHIRALAAPQEKASRIKTLKLTAVIVVITALVLTLCWAAIMSLSGVEASDPLDSTGETDNRPSASATIDDPTHYAEIVIRDHGTVTVALDGNIAPKTVENFKKLADDHFYDSLTFHRIMDGFMMQGGDPKADGTGGSDDTITGEFSSNGIDNPLSHVRGAISMARSNDYDSASSQFFIVHEDSLFLDGDYAAFGYVIDGMDIVDAICSSAEPIDGNGLIDLGDQPVMETVTVYDAEEYEAAH